MYLEDVIEEEKEEAREIGLAEGREKGLAEGRERGLAEGRAEGRAKGRAEGHTEGLSKGLLEGKIQSAIIAINEFNISVELAAEKFNIPLESLKAAYEH